MRLPMSVFKGEASLRGKKKVPLFKGKFCLCFVKLCLLKEKKKKEKRKNKPWPKGMVCE